MYFGPSLLPGSLRFKYFVERYILSPTWNAPRSTCLLSTCFFWLSVALSRAFFTLPQMLWNKSTQSDKVTDEGGSWGPSGMGMNSTLVATLNRVNPVLLCTQQESCPVRLLVIYIAMQVLFHHFIQLVGWKAELSPWEDPTIFINSLQNLAVNWTPRSEMKCLGTLCRQ